MKKMLILLLVLAVPSVMFGTITAVEDFASYALGAVAKGSAPAPFVDSWQGTDPITQMGVVTGSSQGGYGTQSAHLFSSPGGSGEAKVKWHVPLNDSTNTVLSVVWKKVQLGGSRTDKMLMYIYNTDGSRQPIGNLESILTDPAGNIKIGGVDTFTYSADTWGIITYELDWAGNQFQVGFSDENGDQGSTGWLATAGDITWDASQDILLYTNMDWNADRDLYIDALAWGNEGLPALPEPMTIALLSLGGLLIRRKR